MLGLNDWSGTANGIDPINGAFGFSVAVEFVPRSLDFRPFDSGNQ